MGEFSARRWFATLEKDSVYYNKQIRFSFFLTSWQEGDLIIYASMYI